MKHALQSSPRLTVAFFRAGWAILLLVVLINAVPYRRLVSIDDAYISYRYAQNLLEHGQLAYNLDGDKAFAATSPGYVVLLAGLGLIGLDLQAAGYLLGVLATLLAAGALANLLGAWPVHAGLGAGVLLALLPVFWVVVGMESLPVMALVLLAFALTMRGHHKYAAVCLAFATVLRFDAITAAAAWALWLVIGTRRRAVRPLILYGAGTLAVYALMRLLLGAPLPTTLASKQAQVPLGITGFAPHTTFFSGIGLLAQAHIQQSPAYWAAGILAIAGALGIMLLAVRHVRHKGLHPLVADRERTGRTALVAPVILLALWALAHLAAYLLLGVTPYLWYYVPFLPLTAALIAAGVTLAVLRLKQERSALERRWLIAGAAGILWVVVLVGPVTSHLTIRNTQPELGGGQAPVAHSLLLPGSQWGPYKTIGELLRNNTPPDATVGMVEIGIPGYYSRRPVVDFLGLLDTDIADALARGDMSWALYAQQPDYVMFGKGYPMYSFNVYQDRWFQTAYAPRWQIPNRVPEGNWWIVYERRGQRPAQGPVAAVPPSAEPLAIRYGDTFELLGMDAPPGPWRPEDPTGLTFYWRTLKTPSEDYVLFVHLRDSRSNIIAGRDAPPLLGARPTTQWQPGELIADYHPLALPLMPVAPTTIRFEVGLYEGETGTRLPAFGPDGQEMLGGEAHFGSREILPASQPLRFGSGEPGNVAQLAIANYHLSAPSLIRGQSIDFELGVSECTAPVHLTAELWDSPGQRVIWQQEMPITSAGVFKLRLGTEQNEPATEGELRVRVRTDDASLAWLDVAGHVISDYAPLTQVTFVSP